MKKTPTRKAYNRLLEQRAATPRPLPGERLLETAFDEYRACADALPDWRIMLHEQLASTRVENPSWGKPKLPKEQILGDSTRVNMLCDCAEMFDVKQTALLKAIRKLRAKARAKNQKGDRK